MMYDSHLDKGSLDGLMQERIITCKLLTTLCLYAAEETTSQIKELIIKRECLYRAHKSPTSPVPHQPF